jgi:hypothetical protein
MSAQSEYDPKVENRAAFKLALMVLWFVIVSSMLLGINTWMIYSLSQAIGKLLPNLAGISILIQLLIFIGPMVLLYLEWFAWDMIFAQFYAMRRRIGRRRNST